MNDYFENKKSPSNISGLSKPVSYGYLVLDKICNTSPDMYRHLKPNKVNYFSHK